MDISQREVICYALFLCGGGSKFVDTEDVAVKADEIAPGRFSWRKYPYPDKEIVRAYLSDLKKEKYGELVDGTGKRGWALTYKGNSWISGNIKRLESIGLTSEKAKPRSGSVDSLRLDRETKRLKGLAAWALWISERSEISISQAREVFRVDSYSDQEIAKMKIGRVKTMFMSDPDLSEFLEIMERLVMGDIHDKQQ
jgi:hypothetical protein